MRISQWPRLKLILALTLAITALTGCLADGSAPAPAPVVTSPPQFTSPPLPPAAPPDPATPSLPQSPTPAATPDTAAPPLPQYPTAAATPEPSAPPLPQSPTPTATPKPAAPPLSQPTAPTATPKPPATPEPTGATPGTKGELDAPGGENDFSSVAAGANHTCGLRADGMAQCWGDDREGATAAPETPFRSLSAGEGYTCGIQTNGQVSCWGIWGISYGINVGCCNTYRKPEPPSAVFKSISAGRDHACGIKSDDTLECWGENSRSIGDFSEHTGQAIAPAGAFRSVSAGAAHSCGVTADHQVVCWGYGYDEQSIPPPGAFRLVRAGGRGRSCGLKTDATVLCWEANYQGLTTPVAGPFEALSADGDYACGVKITGELECWGPWGGVPPQGKFRSVSVGGLHSCAIRSDGAVVCWGSNFWQELGLQERIACGVLPNRAILCPGEENYNLLAAIHSDWIYRYHHNGVTYPCGKGPDGAVMCWDPYTEAFVGPRPREIVSFSAAGDSACWLLPDGTVACVGWGGSGINSPTGTFQAIAVGAAVYSDFGCGLRRSGKLACWGEGHDWGNIYPPKGLFKAVSLGYLHGCALKLDDSVACWGSVDTYGRGLPPPGPFRALGGGDAIGHCGIRLDDTLDCWGDIQTLPGTFQAVSVGSGRGDYCGVRSDGAVACAAGENSAEIPPPEGPFQSVSLGWGHRCGVLVSGAVACWGRNTDYDGTEVIGQATPPAGEFHSVYAGENFTCGHRTDHTLACWGQVPEVLQNLSGLSPP